jgi:hypothetical protein
MAKEPRLRSLCDTYIYRYDRANSGFAMKMLVLNRMRLREIFCAERYAGTFFGP